jgi:hypothetical protein
MVPGSDWVAGEHGYALDYDGNDDHVLIPDSESLHISAALSVVLWVRITNFNNYMVLVEGREATYAKGFYLYIYETTNDFRFRVFTDGVNSEIDSGVLTASKWYHFAAVYDGSNAIIYIDGKYEASDVANGSILQHTTDKRVGLRLNDIHPFLGQIGDLSIYNRALTANEIAAMYAGAGPLILKPEVIGWVEEEVEPERDPWTHTYENLILKSRERVRHPTYSTFIGGHGDISGDTLNAQYKRRAEDSLHEPNYGTGTLTITDDQEKYIESGRTVFRHGDQVMLFAGFDDINTPVFSGLVREIQVQASQKVQTLTIAEQGYRLRKSKTSGDFSSYDTPKKLVDYLVGLARIGDIVYEDETGPPTTFTFGNTDLSLRSFWAMVHGAALCIQYIQFFDEKGRLNLRRRTSFDETGYVFTDSEIHRLVHVQLAELINHKTIDFVKCVTPEFTAGDGVNAGQHTRSQTDSTSKHKYGEYEDQETDELIGSWSNAGKMIDQILDHYPFPMHIYEMEIPALPQLQISDRIFVRSEETRIQGFFVVIGKDETMTATSYRGKYSLLSAGELF